MLNIQKDGFAGWLVTISHWGLFDFEPSEWPRELWE
jgi:hypothetical protein